jgi:hypothetical protein
MKEIEGFRVSSRWLLAVVGLVTLFPSALVAETELKCVTKYVFYGHLRNSNERGDCTSADTIDGPALAPFAVDGRGGKGLKDDKISTLEAEVVTMKDDVFKTTLRQRPTARLTTTAVAEGYLRPGSGSLLSVGYLGEVDTDETSKCVNSRFLKVTCEIVPAAKK